MTGPPAIVPPGPGPRQRALSLLRRIIAEGRIASGAELPPGRELARILGIPQATLFRALGELEAAGVVERTAWGGRRVVGVDGLAADLEHGDIPAGGLHGTVVVGVLGTVLLRERAPGWADRQVIGAVERIIDLGDRSLLVHLRQLRPGDLDRLIAGRPKGVIVPEADHAWAETAPVIRRLLDAGLAVVLGAEHPALPEADAVLSDHADGAAQLVAWLHARGRRHLVQCLPPAGESTWPHDRRRGFAAAVRRLGLELHPPFEFTTILGEDPRAGYAWEVNRRYARGALAELLRTVPQVDAILAVTDPDTLALAAALRGLDRGIELTGYDNYLDAGVRETAFESFRPAATIDKDNAVRGAAMVDLLHRRLAGGLPPGAVRELRPPRLMPA